jgi:hypothetical protein
VSRDPDRCASPKCRRILTGKTVIITRDGRRWCKHHGDRLPRFLRRQPRVPKPLIERGRTVTTDLETAAEFLRSRVG